MHYIRNRRLILVDLTLKTSQHPPPSVIFNWHLLFPVIKIIVSGQQFYVQGNKIASCKRQDLIEPTIT